MLDFSFVLFEAFMRLLGIVFALMLIIFVHEGGHYLVGRWSGIRITVFSLGLGPKLFGYTDKRGTRWQFSLIPFGGYVKFYGEEEADTACMEKQAPDSFSSANVWKRFATVFAGPLFNTVFAIILLSFLFFFTGRAVLIPTVADIIPGSPAEQAGILPGDKILSIEGREINSFFDISRYVMNYENEPITLIVERHGCEKKIIVVPQLKRVDDGFGNAIHAARIGIVGSVNSDDVQQITYGFFEAFLQSVKDTAHVMQSTWRFLGKFFHGRGDRCQLSGPLRTAEIAWKVSDIGFIALLKLVAFFSVSVGIFNLFPIPPLDGGHLIFYCVEGITGRPISLRIQDIFFRVGILIILFLIAFAVINNSIPC